MGNCKARSYLLAVTVQWISANFEKIKKFPDSWVLRLAKENIDVNNEERIKKSWDEILDIKNLAIDKKTPENPYPYKNGKFTGLLEVPIAPLKNPIDFLLLLPKRKRKYLEGIHIENFNNKIWKTDLVKLALVEMSNTMKILGVIKWIPSWSLDRLLGLFLQSMFFECDKIIGHRLPDYPEQIRYIVKSNEVRGIRLVFLGELLLLKRFPQYPYFWNLIFWQIRPSTMVYLLTLKFQKYFAQ